MSTRPTCPVCPETQLVLTRDEDQSATGYFCTSCTAWWSFADLVGHRGGDQ